MNFDPLLIGVNQLLKDVVHISYRFTALFDVLQVSLVSQNAVETMEFYVKISDFTETLIQLNGLISDGNITLSDIYHHHFLDVVLSEEVYSQMLLDVQLQDVLG